jgi:hypothetical protein
VTKKQIGTVQAPRGNRRSEHPVIYATIATVAGGLILAEILALLHRPIPSAQPSRPNTSRPTPPSHTHGSSSGPIELFSGEVNIPNGHNLTYDTGATNEILFSNYESLGYLSAGSGGSLSVLSAPMPALNAAYQACEDSSNRTSRVALNTLAPVDTLCSFTPNNEVAWVRLLGTTTGEDSFDDELHVETVIFQGSK